MRSIEDLSCPSAQPTSEDARVFGVVLGSVEEPRVAYLDKGTAVPANALKGSPGISPTRIFRFAGKCASSTCVQFQNGGCRLGRDVAERLEAVERTPPPCSIRATCRWFAENGPAVCLRCARVVTDVRRSDGLLAPIARLAAPVVDGHRSDV